MIMRTLLPILLIIAAIAMHIMYIKPQLAEITAVKEEVITIEEALVDADSVEEVINKLAAEEAEISPHDRERLAQILPKRDDINPVLLVNNINTSAIQSGLTLKTIEYSYDVINAEENDGDNNIQVIHFDFNVEAPYVSFMKFLRIIEQSDQLYDVSITKFKVPSTNAYEYSVTLKKYFLE